MALKRCPECGAEYIDIVARCADCGVPLVSTATDASAEGDEAEGSRPPRAHHHEDDDEVDFDLSDWTTDERGLLDGRLTEALIPHRWEGGGAPFLAHHASTTQEQWQIHDTLVVREEHADAVEEILDEVEYPDALDAVLDDGAEDEASYQIMSDLYVAADRLKNNPTDADAAADLGAAQVAAATSSIPYGVEIRVWEQVQDLARSIAEAADVGADDDVVAADAARLRDILSRFV